MSIKANTLLCLVLTLALATGCPHSFAKKQTPWDQHMAAGKQALHAGNYAEARADLDQALTDTHQFQMKDPRLGDTYFCLGELNRGESNYGEAKAYYERALEIQQQTPGIDELVLADTLWGLAKSSEMLGDRQMAMILLKRVRDIWTRKYGANSPELLKVLKPLGIYATVSTDYPSAEQSYRQLVRVSEQVNGPSKPETAAALNLLAMTLARTGQYSEAQSLGQRACSILANAPEYSSLYDEAADNLAFINHQLGRDNDPIPAPKQTATNSAPQQQQVTPSPVVQQQATASSAPAEHAGAAISNVSINQAMRAPAHSVMTNPNDFRPWELSASVNVPAQAPVNNPTLGRIRYLAGGRLLSKSEYDAMLLANEAYELLREQKYKMACDVLRRALGVCPQLASAHVNLGLALTAMGNPSEAIDNLKEAISLDPTKSAAWVNLASAFQASGQLQASVATYQEFVKRFPSHALCGRAKELIAHLQKEADEQHAVEVALQIKNAGSARDYLAYASYPGQMRWSDSKHVLRVYIKPSSGVPGYSSEYDGFCRESFKQWAQASKGQIAFEFTDNPSNADIDWNWTNDFSKVSSIAEGGEANVSSSGKQIQHASVVVLTANASVDSPVSPNQIRAVCLHEIGHALGLIGHSPQPEDVMFCSVPPATAKPALSPRDVGTIQRLYSDNSAA